MSQGRQHIGECFICHKSEVCISRLPHTRNNKKDNLIQCDCCKCWFHAICGGYSISQYSKICRENVWIKCAACCVQQILLAETGEDTVSRINLLIDTARNRISAAASAKGGKKKVSKKSVENSETPCKVSQLSLSTPSSSVDNKVGDTLDVKKPVHQTVNCSVIDTPVAIDNSGHSVHKSIEVIQDSDVDKILVICPIAIVYSYGTDNKIGLRLSVCVSVCLSVCHHSHGRISLSIFTKFDTEV